MAVIKLSKSYEKEFVHEPTGSKIKTIGNGSRVYVTGMHTPPEHRGKGGANAVMSKLTKHLDRRGIYATLHATALDDDTDQNRLEKLYSKHGFQKDPYRSNGVDMTRKPKSLREFLEESADLVEGGNSINWERFNREKKAREERRHFMPKDKPEPSYALTPEMRKRALKNRMERGSTRNGSKRPITLPTLPGKKSEE